MLQGIYYSGLYGKTQNANFYCGTIVQRRVQFRKFTFILYERLNYCTQIKNRRKKL